MAISKNQRSHRGGHNPFHLPDSDCLPKFNFSNGAGWKSTKKAKIGGVPSHRAFDGRKKRRGGPLSAHLSR
jgi:hypothetical protein